MTKGTIMVPFSKCDSIMTIKHIKSAVAKVKKTGADIGYTVKRYTGENLIEAAKIMLKHRLYVGGWAMRQYAVDCIDSKANRDHGSWAIFIAYDKEGNPIAASTHAAQFDSGTINVYVKPSSRRAGIGKEIAKMCKRFGESKGYVVRAYEGSIGSPVFFRKSGVFCY